ncbi:MAG: branched-chain amino acid ABC transporter permease [Syntrophobacterales bacterium]|nr:branched-chain amino acid ABC transporter permease [Syntrophobacterales bacterium]
MNKSRLFKLLPPLVWLIILSLGWIHKIPESFLSVLTTAFLYGAMATAWNIHALSGVTSLGHAAFFGLGAYGFALAISKHGFPFWTGLLAGACCAVIYALLWILSIDKLRHGSFVLATFVSVEIPRVIIENVETITNGSAGIMNIRVPNLPIPIPTGLQGWYVITVALTGILLWLHHKALFSRWGWGLKAIRDNERAALAVGVPVDFLRRLTLLLSSFFMGVCGGIYASIIGFVEPSVVFGLHFSAIPLVFSLFGGKENAWGPLLGAIILCSLDQLIMVPLFPEAHRAIYGISLFLTLWFLPKGILAWKKTG